MAKCKRCGNEAGTGRVWCISCCVTRSRRNKLKKLKDYFGGKCEICGYDKCIMALDFHHTDPLIKEKSITQIAHKNFDILMVEAKKCILICANCHREIHEDKSWKQFEDEVVYPSGRRPHSEDTKAKISKFQTSRVRQPLSDEIKKKISETMKKTWAGRKSVQ